MAPSIYDWSTTEANNATADSGINWQEGQLPSTVNNSARYMMRRGKELLNDIGAVATAGGTANAITVGASSPFTAYTKGIRLLFKASATNTGAATLNVNSVGAKNIVRLDAGSEVGIGAGTIVSGGLYEVVYDPALASAAGAWVLVNRPTLNNKGADIASAATTDLSTATGDYVTVTGTTTITALGTAPQGTTRRVLFSGILTLTHNATSLILLGGANITTAAGDIATFVSEGSGNWRQVGYSQVARNPTFPVYLPTQNATGTGTIDFLPPKGTTEIIINHMAVSTNNTGSIILRLGTGGVPDTTGYAGSVSSVSNALLFSSGTGFFDFTSDANNVREGKVILTLAEASTNTWTVAYHLGLSDTANTRSGGGTKALSGPLDIIRLTMSTGQFDQGKFSVICR